MLFPKSAQSAIANAFYDKEFRVLSFETQLGLEGDARKVFEPKGDYLGNIRFTNLAKLQQELGLTEQIAVAITCEKNVEIAAGDYFEYMGKRFLAFEVQPRDSHLLILGKNDG